MSARLRIIPVALVLGSCTSAPPSPGITPDGPAISRVGRDGSDVTVRLATPSTAAESTVRGSLEQVWSVVPAAYASLSIPVEMRDPDRHVIGNQQFTVRRTLGDLRLSRLVNCGYGPAGKKADRYLVHLRVLTQLSAEGAGAVLAKTSVTAYASTVEGTSTEEVRCPSTGVLETAITEAMRDRLSPGSTPPDP